MPSSVPGAMPKIIAEEEEGGEGGLGGESESKGAGGGAAGARPPTPQPPKLHNPAAADLNLDPAAEWAAMGDEEVEVGAGAESGWA